MPKFTCHSVLYNNNPISWCILGEGRFYKGAFLDAVKNRARLEFPSAEFEESFSITWGEEPLLRLGVEAYKRAKAQHG